ncbi:redox-regulated ATPase YchF [bacterium]|nr:redox-regulated ATPase YchF [bacterium]
MKVGLIGLPQSGKTTLFNALTNLKIDVSGYAIEKIESHIGAVKVPDPRIDHLCSVYNPKKVSLVEMTFTDIGCKKRDDGRSEFDVQALRGLDMLAVVIRAFESDTVLHPLGEVNPMRDLRYLESEFILEDLDLIEKRLERIKKDIKRNNKEAVKEQEYLIKFKAHLEQEKPLLTYEFDAQGEKLFRGFQFLTLKPVLLVFNTGETESNTVDYKQAQEKINTAGGKFLCLCAKLEMEIVYLDDEDKELFLEELGINEPVLNRFIITSFELLDRSVFFTVGPDEVKAWEIPSKISAKEAAGKIHSDIARGFIRAEVLAYNDFVKCDNSYTIARSKGLVRLEGKEYNVKDGDIIEFRFNV